MKFANEKNGITLIALVVKKRKISWKCKCKWIWRKCWISNNNLLIEYNSKMKNSKNE